MEKNLSERNFSYINKNIMTNLCAVRILIPCQKLSVLLVTVILTEMRWCLIRIFILVSLSISDWKYILTHITHLHILCENISFDHQCTLKADHLEFVCLVWIFVLSLWVCLFLLSCLTSMSTLEHIYSLNDFYPFMRAISDFLMTFLNLAWKVKTKKSRLF